MIETVAAWPTFSLPMSDSLKETWYYLKDGHRWVVKFLNGSVTKIQIF